MKKAKFIVLSYDYTNALFTVLEHYNKCTTQKNTYLALFIAAQAYNIK